MSIFKMFAEYSFVQKQKKKDYTHRKYTPEV